MRGFRMQRAAVFAVIFLLGGVLVIEQAPAQNQGPCVQIKMACEQAGFQQGAAKEGHGLLVDCIRPIIQGLPQRPEASVSLPEINRQLVAACRARNRNFGQPKAMPPGTPDQAAPPPEPAAPR
jgi:hypothetical protein